MPWLSEVFERFQRASNSICRISIDGATAGTGFLVGPDLVLTNFHVIEGALGPSKRELPDGLLVRAVACVFDDRRLPGGGFNEGLTVPVEPQCVMWSKYSPAEITESPYDPLPTTDELDYALLRLIDSVGDRAVPGDDPRRQRGWIDLFDTTGEPARNDPVVVIQHPRGTAQFYYACNYETANDRKTRFVYNMVEARGSSGSPSLTGDFRIFALHHMGDGDWLPVHPAQGVPITLIRDQIIKINAGALSPFSLLAHDPTLTPWDAMFAVIKQDPSARASLGESRQIIRAVASQIRRLKRFKIVHDALQGLQSQMSSLKAMLSESDFEKSRMALRMTGRVMGLNWLGHSATLEEIRRNPTDGRQSTWRWSDELETAMRRMRELKPDETLSGYEAVAIIRGHLRLQLPSMNAQVVAILAELPIDKLLDVFAKIAITLPQGSIRDLFNEAPSLLKKLWDSLKTNVEEHNNWQDVENHITLLEETPPPSTKIEMMTFKASWSIAWGKASPLCGQAPAAAWSIDVQSAAAKVQEALDSNKWDLAIEAIADFQYAMGIRFRNVDKTLLAQSDEVIQLGDPLASLVEAIL